MKNNALTNAFRNISSKHLIAIFQTTPVDQLTGMSNIVDKRFLKFDKQGNIDFVKESKDATQLDFASAKLLFTRLSKEGFGNGERLNSTIFGAVVPAADADLMSEIKRAESGVLNPVLDATEKSDSSAKDKLFAALHSHQGVYGVGLRREGNNRQGLEYLEVNVADQPTAGFVKQQLDKDGKYEGLPVKIVFNGQPQALAMRHSNFDAEIPLEPGNPTVRHFNIIPPMMVDDYFAADGQGAPRRPDAVSVNPVNVPDGYYEGIWYQNQVNFQHDADLVSFNTNVSLSTVQPSPVQVYVSDKKAIVKR